MRISIVRWGLCVIGCIIISAIGLVLAENLGISQRDAVVFPVVVAAVAWTTAKMASTADPAQSVLDLVILSVCLLIVVVGVVVLALLCIVMMVIHLSLATPVYFILLIAEWILISFYI